MKHAGKGHSHLWGQSTILENIVYTYVCAHVYFYFYLCIHIHICVCVCVYIYVCMFVCIGMDVCVCGRVRKLLERVVASSLRYSYRRMWKNIQISTTFFLSTISL